MNNVGTNRKYSPSMCVWKEHNVLAIQELNGIWREVLDLGRHETVKTGTCLYEVPLGKEEYFSFLDKGMLRLSCVSHNGMENILLYICDGCLFKELSWVAPNATAEFFAMEDCEIWNFPHDLLLNKEFTVEHPLLMINLVQSLMQKAGAFFSRQTEHYELSPEEKICRFLMRIDEMAAGAQQPVFTQAEMAKALGLHRSTVCRILRELRIEGIVGRCTKTHLDILDRKALRGLCNFSA